MTPIQPPWLKKCTERAKIKKEHADEVIEFIKTKNPTPGDLETFIAPLQEYNFTHGNMMGEHALTAAAYVGSIPLIRHILRTHKETLHLGDGDGRTPFFWAIMRLSALIWEFRSALTDKSSVQNQFDVIKELLRLGSDLNLSYENKMNAYMTPLGSLSVDLRRQNILFILKFLLKYGAQCYPEVQGRSKTILDTLQKMLDEEKAEDRKFILSLSDGTLLSFLPRELSDELIRYRYFQREIEFGPIKLPGLRTSSPQH